MLVTKKTFAFAVPAGLLLLFLVVLNSDIFFGGRTILPIAPSYTVLPTTPAGYSGPVSSGYTSLDPAGSLNVSYAFDALTQVALKDGHLPLWNPFQGLGQPFLGNGISSVLSPFTWLASLFSPAWWDVIYLLPWLLAAFFFYAYLRLWKLDRGASLFGASTILASGLIQFYAMLREYGGVIAWLPLLLYSVERVLREPTWRLRHIALGLGIYGMISAGQPEVYVVAVLTVIGYACIRLITFRHNLKQIVFSLLPGMLGGSLLTLPALISFGQYAFDAFSLHDPGMNVGLKHLPFKTMLSYFFPFLFGRNELSTLEAGWFPFLGFFTAVATVLLKRRLPAAGWLALTAFLLMGAKIWGVPIINSLGDLPLLDRIQFPKYASFILTFSLASLSAFGLQALTQISTKTWRNYLIGWCSGVGVLWATSLWLVWEKIDLQHILSTEAGVYGVMGGVWAMILPIGVWWVKQKKPDQKDLLYLTVGVGVGLQAIAYAFNGYQLHTYANLSLLCLGVFIAAAGIFTSSRLPFWKTLTVSAVTLAAIPLFTAYSAEQGLPARHNPLTSTPYIEKLQELQQNGLYRSYAFDGTPQPNFAAPFKISSLNNVEALLPTATADFYTSYLDRTVSPIWFAGNYSWNRIPGTAISEYQANKKYFDLVGTKYILNIGSEYVVTQYDTESVDQNRIPIQIGGPLESTFNAPSTTLKQLQVLLSTYGKINPGILTASLLNEQGVVLYQEDIRGESIVDNGLQNFYPSVDTLPGQTLTLRVDFSPESPTAQIAAWRYPAHPELGFSFRVVDTPYSVIFTDPENRIFISENPDALPRVFLATQARVEPDWKEALNGLHTISDLHREVIIDQGEAWSSEWPLDQPTGETTDFHLEPNGVSFTYNAHTPGILVLTDSYANGWHVEINGQPETLFRVDGAFRGVKIDQAGKYQVRFWYRPLYWNISLGLALAGLLLISGFTLASFFWRRVAK